MGRKIITTMLIYHSASAALGSACVIAIALCLGVLPKPAVADNAGWKTALMSFDDAAKPYAGYKYSLHGYVNASGNVATTRSKPNDDPEKAVKGEEREGYIDNALGCSAYAAVVLYQMKFGDAKGKDGKAAWVAALAKDAATKNADGTANWAHWKTGSGIAAHFGLALSATLQSNELGKEAVKAKIEGKALVAGRWYLFSVVKEELDKDGKKKITGHTGFVKFGADGSMEQRHYSHSTYKNARGAEVKWDGLATGEFSEWYAASPYRSKGNIKGTPVEVYLIPETK